MGGPVFEASPKYPWRSYSALRTHAFIEDTPREAWKPLRVFFCRSCHRRFKFDPETRVTSAIGSDEKLSPVRKALGSRWLSEPCAGQPETD